MPLFEKIKGLRKRVQTRKKRRAAKKRKQKTRQAAQNLRSQRRVERGNPETLSEDAKATVNEAKKLGAELGITRDRADKLTSQASGLASSVGGQLDSIDADDISGDGLVEDMDMGTDMGDIEAVDVDTRGGETGQMDFGGGESFSEEYEEGSIEDDLGL